MMRHARSTALALILLAALAAMPLVHALEDPVRIETGLVTGAEALPAADGTPAIRVYKGIPFAAPPVGDLRWKAPERAAAWEGVRACTEFGPGCPQARADLAALNPERMDEDCLYLNIWTPAAAADVKLPVMVWIHGGGFIMGHGASALYHGHRLAQQGVILVSINYRLGALGFFAHPALSAESPKRASGNYGMLDQIAALEWVQRNIAAFGGDPGNVTIFGESAGGMSVCWLMNTPMSKGLFHKAVSQSGTAAFVRHLREPWYGATPMEELGAAMAERAGAGNDAETLAKLRGMPADALINGLGTGSLRFFERDAMTFGPIVDGHVFVDDPIEAYLMGRVHDVPLMIGANANEGALFAMLMGNELTAESYPPMIQSRFGPVSGRILEAYPAPDAAAAKKAAAEVIGNVYFVAPARAVARSLSKRTSPVYHYHFAHRLKGGLLANLGATHGMEIPFVFGNIEEQTMLGGAPNDADAAAQAKLMSRYWTNFAKHGDPNGEGLPEWPRYREEEDASLVFENGARKETGVRKADCDLADAFIHGLLSSRGGS